MARTTQEIFDSMVQDGLNRAIAASNSTAIAMFSNYSATAIWRLLFYVVAFAIFTLENLFDICKADTLSALAEMKPHSLRWYRNQSLIYQYGYPLNADGSGFDNTNYSDEEVEDSKIVDYSAVVEQTDISGRLFLRMKLAHDNGLDLEPLQNIQLDAFKEWFNTTQKDAGVKLQIDSLPADSLKQTWVIYYNPLILSATGARLDGTDETPVQDGIKAYLKNLPFNGVFVPTYHIDAVEAIEGVVIPELAQCQAQYGSLPFSPVMTKYVPDSGYLRFASDADLNISFIAQTPLK